jgi:pectate lyase
MTVGPGEIFRVGPSSIEPPGTLDLDVDNAFESMVNAVNERLSDQGSVIARFSSIHGALVDAADDEVVRLLPGRYRLQGTIEVASPVTIRGIGTVRIVSDGTAFQVTGSAVTIENITFVQTSTTDTKTISLEGAYGSVNDCTFVGAQTNAMLVGGNNCFVRNCRFSPDEDQSSADADVYWGDDAEDGVAVGNMWSTERGYVISYKSGTDFTQAANAKAAAIQAR